MYFLDLLGTLAFTISGALKAKGRSLNIFRVVFLGVVTAVGGGTVRDLISNRTPLFYLKDPNYLLIAVIGAVLAFVVPAFFKKQYSFFRFLDSIGLATFAIIGVSVSYNHLYDAPSLMSFLTVIFMGVLTGCGGGVLRDAIMGDTPFALKHGSNYISSAFWGALIFYLLMFMNVNLAVAASMTVTMVLREIISPYGIYKRINTKPVIIEKLKIE